MFKMLKYIVMRIKSEKNWERRVTKNPLVFRRVKPCKSASNVGMFDGKFNIIDDIDFCNDEIAEMFDEENGGESI